MSSEHVVYIGPYVVAKSHPVKNSKDMITCTNASCERHGTHLGCDYCPKCGTKVEMGKVEIDGYSVEPWKMMEIVDEHMVYHKDKGTDYWSSNLTTMSKRAGRSLNMEDEEEAYALTSKIKKRETEIFLELHSEHISKLMEVYDNLEIVWGVLAYWR